jgi:fatty-acid peroxygenase
MFAEEVRRYYPFLPAIGGRALHDFDWHGMRIAKGTWVLLDLYGTDHPSGDLGRPRACSGPSASSASRAAAST